MRHAFQTTDIPDRLGAMLKAKAECDAALWAMVRSAPDTQNLVWALCDLLEGIEPVVSLRVHLIIRAALAQAEKAEEA